YYLRACSPHDLPSFPTRRSSDLVENPFTAGYSARAPPFDKRTGSPLREFCTGHGPVGGKGSPGGRTVPRGAYPALSGSRSACVRSEEHTSELQSRFDLVCRLLLE